jgi:hypothetical protein
MSFDGYAARHFSLANKRNGKHENDLPYLLRRVAEAIEGIGIQPMEILDVTIGQEITENGPWWSATVYWSPDSSDDSPAR